MVVTFIQTPRLKGLGMTRRRRFKVFKVNCKAGALDLAFKLLRGCLINWLIVGIFLVSLDNKYPGCLRSLRRNGALAYVS